MAVFRMSAVAQTMLEPAARAKRSGADQQRCGRQGAAGADHVTQIGQARQAFCARRQASTDAPSEQT
ncbi:hypothetical protein [Collimonas humicola]|uniref:hypothetical protein n=1 Tax=Collimonas humicola TaxID=2825886 RepID=UPI001B8B4CB2|nr:hypothetical protein [Collimonas humicola]